MSRYKFIEYIDLLMPSTCGLDFILMSLYMLHSISLHTYIIDVCLYISAQSAQIASVSQI